ncbi:CTC-interacting domain 6 [Euphorbia peplus]|nr:CTC-interacting domain 6 [Euphorbia peplus]
MKTGISTLNPYAASYVPLFKREVAEKGDVSGAVIEVAHSSNQALCFGPAEHATQKRQHEKTSSVNEASVLKSHPSDGFYGSSSQNSFEMTDHQIMDDPFDMHLVYLQMQFPGISDESLNDVYIANKGDLEATVDMLHQLEFDPFESPENLPDSLDIGDVAESGSSAESVVKSRNVVGEAGASSSGSSAADPVIIT